MIRGDVRNAVVGGLQGERLDNFLGPGSYVWNEVVATS